MSDQHSIGGVSHFTSDGIPVPDRETARDLIFREAQIVAVSAYLAAGGEPPGTDAGSVSRTFIATEPAFYAASPEVTWQKYRTRHLGEAAACGLAAQPVIAAWNAARSKAREWGLLGQTDPRSWVLEIELGRAYNYLHTVRGLELDYA